MSKLRFGICGLGCMGRNHLARLWNHPHAEVVAVCDQDESRRSGQARDALGNLDQIKIAGEPVDLRRLRAYATPEPIIADPDIDIVLIALPTPFHAPVAIAALEAAKHVFTEKPMARGPGECSRMVAAAEASDRTLMVGQCLRFWPQYEAIKQYVDDGRIGPVQFVALRRLASAPTYSAGDWLLNGHESGGAILDLHVHDIDFSQHLLGLPDSLHALGTPGPTGGIDHVVATHRYADGRYALIEGGWTLAAPWPFQMEILVSGERGTLHWNSLQGNAVQHYARGAQPEEIVCSGDAYARELDYFIDCVRTQQPVLRCTPASTRLSIILAWLERRSIELGRPIVVNEHLRAAWTE